jgi:hypothetical protein
MDSKLLGLGDLERAVMQLIWARLRSRRKRSASCWRDGSRTRTYAPCSDAWKRKQGCDVDAGTAPGIVAPVCCAGIAVWLALQILRVRNPHIQMTAWVMVLMASLAMPLLMQLPAPWVTVVIPRAAIGNAGSGVDDCGIEALEPDIGSGGHSGFASCCNGGDEQQLACGLDARSD